MSRHAQQLPSSFVEEDDTKESKSRGRPRKANGAPPNGLKGRKGLGKPKSGLKKKNMKKKKSTKPQPMQLKGARKSPNNISTSKRAQLIISVPRVKRILKPYLHRNDIALKILIPKKTQVAFAGAIEALTRETLERTLPYLTLNDTTRLLNGKHIATMLMDSKNVDFVKVAPRLIHELQNKKLEQENKNKVRRDADGKIIGATRIRTEDEIKAEKDAREIRVKIKQVAAEKRKKEEKLQAIREAQEKKQEEAEAKKNKPKSRKLEVESEEESDAEEDKPKAKANKKAKADSKPASKKSKPKAKSKKSKKSKK